MREVWPTAASTGVVILSSFGSYYGCVYGHTTTAMHEMSTPQTVALVPPKFC